MFSHLFNVNLKIPIYLIPNLWDRQKNNTYHVFNYEKLKKQLESSHAKFNKIEIKELNKNNRSIFSTNFIKVLYY
jgi:hypothetical protein